MDSLTKIELAQKEEFTLNSDGKRVLSEIRDFGIRSVEKVQVTRIYVFAGLTKNEITDIKQKLLLEPIWIQEPNGENKSASFSIEVSLKPGVTNTEIDSILKALSDMGIAPEGGKSARKYYFWGHPTKKELETITNKILLNQTIEKVISRNSQLFEKNISSPRTQMVKLSGKNDAELLEISRNRLLFLDAAEMKVIQQYFQRNNRTPTDCELETLAQTWSEHNGHKTFKAKLIINGKKKKPLYARIKATTDAIDHKDALMTFSDNSGIVSFDKDFAVCAKTETHNSPSALEPFGGAMTGSGGVFRDIAGSGLGAKNIASTDIFCFADPRLPLTGVPEGCLHPKRLLTKCVAGVRVYGNCMGIPTVNGSLQFDDAYRAKPVVLVGAVGILPKKYIRKKKISPGDLVISVGGKTGRDGIHGATFSSGEMSEKTHDIASSAVQIGNPIEEIRMFDALLDARDKGLIKNITDCGGGGYSSAIGEIAKETGVKIRLDQVPLKYSGLSPWEIWLSESQERMLVIIDRKNIKKLKTICAKYNTGVYIIGEITGSRKLELWFKKSLVADLGMNFLHDGLPQKVLTGKWKRYRPNKISLKKLAEIYLPDALRQVIGDLNVASKEEIVRRYDHEIQGKLALKPFVGTNNDGPQDAAVIQPLFSGDRGVGIAHGINIEVSKLDPYWGGIYAVDEAVRNLVSVGIDPRKIFLLDNFIFPKPDDKVIGALDRAVDGICFAAVILGAPFISGKDSLSGTYNNGTEKIDVPPTICVSGIGIAPSVKKTISSDFKKIGNSIMMVGEIQKGLGASILAKKLRLTDDFPHFDLKKAKKLYKKFYRAIELGFICSAHDISEGGLVTTVLEMCFGGELGADVTIHKNAEIITRLFSESGGRFLIEVDPANENTVRKIFKGIRCDTIGHIDEVKELRIRHGKKEILKEEIGKLKNIWQSPFKAFF